MEINVTLYDEQVDDLIRQCLIRDYNRAIRLSQEEPFLIPSKKDQKALKRLIKYYSTEEQYKEWIKRVGDES